MKRFAVVSACALAVAVGLVSGATAAPGVLVGVSDDYLKTEPARAVPAIQDLGLDAVRLTVDWRPGMPSISGGDQAGLTAAATATPGTRIVVAVYSDVADDAPKTPEARDEYCAFVRALVEHNPQIHDVVIWNEPNKSTFWKPQFDGRESAAPRAYLQLLLRCHEVLHAARPSVNVIHAGLSSTGNDRPDAESNVSHSPGNFVRKEGEAYRALFPDAAHGPRAFDTFALHAYGESSQERPWETHPASATIAMGDIGTLVRALWDAFAGTGQPVPAGGPGGARAAAPRAADGGGFNGIWILENGYQTTIPEDKRALYSGGENVPTVAPRGLAPADDAVAPATQAGQLVDAIRIAACNPYVTAYFNFLLRDDDNLGRWQSGVAWADWTPKPAYAALKQIVAEVHAKTVDCSGLPVSAIGVVEAKKGVEVRRVVWPRQRSFNWKHDLWRFRIQATEAASYAARLVRVDGAGHARPERGGQTVLTAAGELRATYYVWVTFPRRRLSPGRYRMEIALTSRENVGRKTTLRGPVLTVRPRPG